MITNVILHLAQRCMQCFKVACICSSDGLGEICRGLIKLQVSNFGFNESNIARVWLLTTGQKPGSGLY